MLLLIRSIVVVGGVGGQALFLHNYDHVEVLANVSAFVRFGDLALIFSSEVG